MLPALTAALGDESEHVVINAVNSLGKSASAASMGKVPERVRFFKRKR